MSSIEFLIKSNKKLAYAQTPGASPGVVFMGGFKSDMTGAKALALEAHCKTQGRAFVRFDYTGHGKSSGKFEEGTIGSWKQDALDIIDSVAKGPQLIVGSSMGGWISMLVARERPKQVAGLIGVASAPDFTEHLIWDKFTKAQKAEMEKKGVVYVPSCNDQPPYPITRALIEDGRKHLLLGGTIDIHCPVHLMHGMLDEDVPWQVAFAINEKLATKDVRTTLIEKGDHRLSEPDNLAALCKITCKMLARIG